MREERKLNKAIQKDGAETQAEILEKLKLKYPQYTEVIECKQQTPKKRRVAVLSALAAAAACVAVVVPCAVLLPKSDNAGGGNGFRYCAQDEYKKDPSEYTIKEYSEKYDSKIHYFDWYDTGEDCMTAYYVSKADNEVLGLWEFAYLPEVDESVELAVTKTDIYLAEHTLVYESTNEQSVSGYTVKWQVLSNGYAGMLENDGYRYIITVETSQNETRLFELVEELLQKN